jgi:hypothetical protein
MNDILIYEFDKNMNNKMHDQEHIAPVPACEGRNRQAYTEVFLILDCATLQTFTSKGGANTIYH